MLSFTGTVLRLGLYGAKSNTVLRLPIQSEDTGVQKKRCVVTVTGRAWFLILLRQAKFTTLRFSLSVQGRVQLLTIIGRYGLRSLGPSK